MSDVTDTLYRIERGDPHAADQLFPLVYDELRKLASHKLNQERPGQTLQATALVNEAYLRLVATEQPLRFNSRGHFFAAAAEAMRRILVENARRKQQVRRGGDQRRIPLEQAEIAQAGPPDDLLELDESLTRLEAHDELAARVVKLRFFAGMSLPEIAQALAISLRTVERNWTYARTWLHRDLL